MKKVVSILLSIMLLSTFAACGGKKVNSNSSKTGGVTTYIFLNCWNGGAADFPDGWDKSPLVAELAKKTGVKLKVETITSSEKEKLATVFASGDLPDITNAPYWSTDPGGEGELIKNAAVDGLILPIKKYIDKYPNIKRMYQEGIVSKTYLDKDINNKEYEGEIYVIPTQTPRTKDDVTNWAYNLFCRKDILASLNIKSESITSTQAEYDLMKKIKDGNFKDINGKPVIVGSTWHDGWNYADFLRGFGTGNVTGWSKDSSGKLVNDRFTQNEIDKVLFMRKLVSEGLFDPECFTQTDTQAKEKIVTGRVAMFGCHYPNEYGFLKGTLYKDHPEMEYVPLGPILNEKGEVPAQISTDGRSGSPVLFFSKKIKNPEKALGFVDYINSDEGLKLVTFGIEGTHYKMDGKVPKYTDEWNNIRATDDTKFKLAGFGLAGNFVGADPRNGWGWNPDYSEAGYVNARKVSPLKFIDYKTADDVVNTWPGKKAYDEKMSTYNYDDELKKAYLAKSDADATKVVEEVRKRMKAAGYDEMVKYLNDEVAKDPKVLN
ncbi:MAG: hypothetical protein QME45_12705 [Clostridiales bacterium]|nr:hypothetical protein [Clostridiales bacterium]